VTKKKRSRIGTDSARSRRGLKIAALTVLAAATAGAIAVLIVRDQVTRHRRDLFAPNVLQRLAALSYMAKSPAGVDSIMLLRDFIRWEPRRMLRGRARSILARMEEEVRLLKEKAAEEKVS
jgi:hypothetical protein